jgi:hypothetical protein
MVENTNSTTLEVQGSFALTYRVVSGVARRGEAGRQAGRRAGVVWCGCVNF